MGRGCPSEPRPKPGNPLILLCFIGISHNSWWSSHVSDHAIHMCIHIGRKFGQCLSSNGSIFLGFPIEGEHLSNKPTRNQLQLYSYSPIFNSSKSGLWYTTWVAREIIPLKNYFWTMVNLRYLSLDFSFGSSGPRLTLLDHHCLLCLESAPVIGESPPWPTPTAAENPLESPPVHMKIAAEIAGRCWKSHRKWN